jgi:hypothetical protein
MSAMQRTKGASYEREVVNELKDLLGPVVRRCWERASDKGHDIDLPGFAPELKRYARIGKVYQWMAQAEAQAGLLNPMPMPIVICRADREESLVIMRLEDFVELAREEICAEADPS